MSPESETAPGTVCACAVAVRAHNAPAAHAIDVIFIAVSRVGFRSNGSIRSGSCHGQAGSTDIFEPPMPGPCSMFSGHHMWSRAQTPEGPVEPMATLSPEWSPAPRGLLCAALPADQFLSAFLRLVGRFASSSACGHTTKRVTIQSGRCPGRLGARSVCLRRCLPHCLRRSLCGVAFPAPRWSVS